MSESKIKLLILTWPRLGPEELLSHLEAGLGRSCRGRHFGAPRSSGAGACAIPSLGLLIDLTEVAASVTMALMALAASAAGGSAPVSCCAPASSKTPVVRYCHEIRGSFLSACAYRLHILLCPVTQQRNSLPSSPNCELSTRGSVQQRTRH